MIVSTIAHAKLIVRRFLKYPDVTVDTETQPKEEYAGDKKSTLIIGRYQVKIWSLCYRGESYSFPTNLIAPKYPTMQQWVEVFRPLFRNSKIRKVAHNFNYDGNAFAEYGVTMTPIWDTVIGCHFANANWERDLKSRANLYGRLLAQTSTVDFSNLEELADYAEMDVVATDEIYQMQTRGKVVRPPYIEHLDEKGTVLRTKNEMKDLVIRPEYESLDKFHRNVIKYQELPTLRAVIRAERHGFPVDKIQVGLINNKIKAENQKLLVEIYRHAKKQFKLGSRKEMLQVFQNLGIKITAKTKKGAPALNAASLFFLQDSHPIVKTILKHRQNEKQSSTYTSPKGLTYFCDKQNRIHCTLNSVGARTGRMSSSSPNLQNLPAAKDIHGIRTCFIAPKGMSLICLDFSQIEIRVMAILCKDPNMMRVLRDKEGDIHQNTADEFQVDRSPTAKQINFLMLYGGGSYALASKLTLEGAPTTPEQAQAYISRYDEVYAEVHNYRRKLLQQHQRQGFCEYLMGRKRYLIDVDWSSRREQHKAETTLSNNICQGSAQDLLKHSIVRCDHNAVNPDRAVLNKFNFSPTYKNLVRDYSFKLEKIRKELKLAKTRWALQVHDETIYFCDKAAAVEIGHKIAEVMTWFPYIEPLVPIDVPIVVDGGVGVSWAQAKGKTPQHKIEHFGQVMDSKHKPKVLIAA